MFFWGLGLGIILTVLILILTPQVRRYLAIQDALTQVQVQKILGVCK